MHVCTCVRMQVCMYVCVYVHTRYVCTYVCIRSTVCMHLTYVMVWCKQNHVIHCMDPVIRYWANSLLFVCTYVHHLVCRIYVHHLVCRIYVHHLVCCICVHDLISWLPYWESSSWSLLTGLTQPMWREEVWLNPCDGKRVHYWVVAESPHMAVLHCDGSPYNIC